MRKLAWLLMPVMTFASAWWIISPGVFTVQPIGAAPEGLTFLYYGRGPDMPLFASPDGLCLKLDRGVSIWCRATAIAGVAPLTERIIVRLPYSRFAYLLSTGGHEFDL
jgi:hypothetical protein